MDAFNARFAKSFVGAIEAKIGELTALLVSTPAPDHSGYCERVGFIRGLKFALQEAHDLEAHMSKPEKKDEQHATRRASYEE